MNIFWTNFFAIIILTLYDFSKEYKGSIFWPVTTSRFSLGIVEISITFIIYAVIFLFVGLSEALFMGIGKEENRK